MSQRELKMATVNNRLATRWDNNLISSKQFPQCPDVGHFSYPAGRTL